MINKSIQTCKDTHKPCQSAQISPLPKRVLDLGPVDDTPSTSQEPADRRKPPYVKLHESRSEAIPYVALSHCWGEKPLLRTLRETLSQMKTNVEWSSLPQSFQDAAKVTRGLGLRYLWIDSLCILQDDLADWMTEAAGMGCIYAGSYVTIAATSAVDSTVGFLARRQQPYELVQTSQDGSIFSVYVRRYISEDDHRWMLLPNGGPINGKKAHALLERGWYFQERMLANRILHYTSGETILECSIGFSYECSKMQSVDHHSLKYLLSRIFNPTFVGMDSSTHELPVEIGGIDKHRVDQLVDAFERGQSSLRFAQGWDFFMQRYSDTKLTYEEDILPALSSLARRMQALAPDMYLAGLWKQRLPHNLLWMSYYWNNAHRAKRTKVFSTDPKGSRRGKSATYVAPSFSWTSRVGPIRWYMLSAAAQVEVEVLRAQCTLGGLDELGDLVDGFIELRGQLVTTTDLKSGVFRKCSQLTDGEWNYLCNIQADKAWDTVEDFDEYVNKGNVPSNAQPRLYHFLKLFSEAGSTVALILRPSLEKPGAYRRVGISLRCDGSAFTDIEETAVTIV
jgi:Heterokaryon incompatibility protein (HET)